MPKRQSGKIGGWEKDGDLWLARKHGESHNLRMRPRFLEFRSEGPHEPTFCQATQNNENNQNITYKDIKHKLTKNSTTYA